MEPLALPSKSELLSRHVAVSAYAIAGLLIFIPMVDTLVAVLPPMPLEVSWRYRAENHVSSALLRPMMGILLAYTVAVVLQHRRVIKAISLASAGLAACFALGIPLFLIDALDMRAGLRPEAQAVFEVSMLVALLKFVLTTLVLVTFALPGWNAARWFKAVAQSRLPRVDPAFVMPRMD